PGLAERAIRLNAVCPGFVDTPMTRPHEGSLREAGFELMPPTQVAEAVLVAARSKDAGQAWVIQPGREPMQFRFPNVPGPRCIVCAFACRPWPSRPCSGPLNRQETRHKG